VNLEPCSHFGRTPPCTRALLAAGVARVVCSLRDPNPRVAGGGLEELARAGVAVESGLLASDAAELNRGFLRRMSSGRPWVTLKVGASLDGRTALASGASRWITGEAARADVQRLRARAAAVVTGIGTVLTDDPALTVRDPGLELLGRRPLRVVLDSRLRIPVTARVLDESAPAIVFTTQAAPDASAFGERSIRIETLPGRDGRIDLAALLDRLGALECNEILVEAGPELAGAFLEDRRVDEFVLYVTPCVLGDTARPMFRLPPLERMTDRYDFRIHDADRIGDDLRMVFRPQGAEH
jgi:diaminohydroxyphosphoribosylaminopyrimidine deaminase/5-amino-6-(5-phosphoribosylamino)uracil reductase